MKIKCFSYTLKSVSLLLLMLINLPLLCQSSNILNVKTLDGSDNINIHSLIDRQTEYIRSSYSKKIETSKEIINGKEYVSYYIRSTSKPLLFPNKKRSASLFTTSRRYDNLTLQYDTFLDEVLLTDTSRTINYTFPVIALNRDNIEGFNLYFEDDSMRFKYFRLPKSSELNLKEGFYEVAFEGKSKYFIKHLSSFYVKDGLNEYKYFTENYINTGSKFYKVSGKASLLNLFGEKSGEIKKFLHTSRIRTRQADKNEYIIILKYYDSLTMSQQKSE